MLFQDTTCKTCRIVIQWISETNNFENETLLKFPLLYIVQRKVSVFFQNSVQLSCRKSSVPLRFLYIHKVPSVASSFFGLMVWNFFFVGVFCLLVWVVLLLFSLYKQVCHT